MLTCIDKDEGSSSMNTSMNVLLDSDTNVCKGKGTKRHRVNVNRNGEYTYSNVNVDVNKLQQEQNPLPSILASSPKKAHEKNDAAPSHYSHKKFDMTCNHQRIHSVTRHNHIHIYSHSRALHSHSLKKRSYSRTHNRAHSGIQTRAILTIQILLTLNLITSFLPTIFQHHHHHHHNNNKDFYFLCHVSHSFTPKVNNVVLVRPLISSKLSLQSSILRVPKRPVLKISSMLYMNINNNNNNNAESGSDNSSCTSSSSNNPNTGTTLSSTNINGNSTESHKNSDTYKHDKSSNVNGIHVNGMNGVNDGHNSKKVNGTLFTSTTPPPTSSSSLPIFPPPSSSISSSFSSLASSIAMLTENDQNQLSYYWSSKLLPHLSYLNPTNHSVIYQALQIAYISHKKQFRKSGEPFIIHPIEVTILLSSLQMDVDTLIAGLLHDTVEDTDLTFNQIESLFGTTVRNIVEGETKVSKLPSKLYSTRSTTTTTTNNESSSSTTIINSEDEQAENLRQMFIAMTNDYRIIIVKLADRLHNMRTLEHMKPAKQQKISKETLEIFAPLAHRMGIWNFKSELEDLSFYYLFPLEYKHLRNKLDFYSQKWNETLEYSKERLIQVLKEDKVLKEQCIDITVNGRTKELYSLYCKMKKKEEDNLDHITDVVALRVILEPMRKKRKTRTMSSSSPSSSGMKTNGYDEGIDENDNEFEYEEEYDNEPDCGVWLCYHVLGLVQHLPGFQPVPTKVRRRKHIILDCMI